MHEKEIKKKGVTGSLYDGSLQPWRAATATVDTNNPIERNTDSNL
jgi:hypothetical protein